MRGNLLNQYQRRFQRLRQLGRRLRRIRQLRSVRLRLWLVRHPWQQLMRGKSR